MNLYRLILILVIGIQLLPETPKPTKQWREPSLNRIIQHPDNQRYIRDSINRGHFMQHPQIDIILQPLLPNIIGITHNLGNNRYLIGLNMFHRQSILTRTLHHELVHVKQFHLNLLDKQTNGIDLWIGKPIDWSLPWASRPWEQMAEEETRQLYNP
tara:strand:- start:96 stop:563 length:468 start_codon:yes stop_codon:yes gene_type:complete